MAMPDQSKGAFLDFGQAYRKAADYCALQDRCISEIQLKLRIWNIDRDFIGKIISTLINEDFLNEKRFALNYAGGKFRIKGWGKLKIAAGLRARNIPPALIQQALAGINNEQYVITLETLLQKKLRLLGGDSVFNRQKAAYFAASRGFETGIIATLMHDIEIVE